MQDSTWVILSKIEALTQIRKWGSKPLRYSCSHYKYFSTHNHPLIKHDTRKNEFFGNEDYRNLISQTG